MFFSRYEKKYLLNDQQVDKLYAYMHVKNHIFSKYVVNSIYYDTLDNTLLNQSFNGDYQKEKLRIRYYNNQPENAFWEKKVKINKKTEKYRIPISYDPSTFSATQVPLFYSKPAVKPKVYIRYQRTVLKDSEIERVTLDDEIKFFRHGFFVEKSVIQHKVLEIKYKITMSQEMKELLRFINASESSYSKYAQYMKDEL